MASHNEMLQIPHPPILQSLGRPQQNIANATSTKPTNTLSSTQIQFERLQTYTHSTSWETQLSVDMVIDKQGGKNSNQVQTW